MQSSTSTFIHRRSRLNAKHIHEEGDQGVSLTTSKVRSSFWIIGLPRMVKSIRYNGVTYKKLDKKTVTTDGMAPPGRA